MVAGLLPALTPGAKAGNAPWSRFQYAVFDSVANVDKSKLKPASGTGLLDHDPFTHYDQGKVLWVHYNSTSPGELDWGALHKSYDVADGKTLILTSAGGTLRYWGGNGSGEDLFQLYNGATMYIGKNIILDQQNPGTTAVCSMAGTNQVYLEGTLTGAGNHFYKASGSFTVDLLPGSRYDATRPEAGRQPTTYKSYLLSVTPGRGVQSCNISRSYFPNWINVVSGLGYSSTYVRAGQVAEFNYTLKPGYQYSGGTSITMPGYDYNLNVNASPRDYTVSLNFQDGFGGTSSVTATFDSAMPKLSYLPTKAGYTFTGYYSAPSGGAQYYDSGGYSAKSWDKPSDTMLYAQWRANTYTVRYNGNGSTSGAMSSSSHVYGQSKALTANAFSRRYTVGYDPDGGTVSASAANTDSIYRFASWNTRSDGNGAGYSDTQAVSTLTTTNGGVVDLYAIWNVGSVTLPTPLRTGYTFEGWYNGSTGVGKSGSYTPTANVTLKARWTQDSYTVTLNAAGGKGGTTQTVTYDAVPANLGLGSRPLRVGYVFGGYYIKENGGGEQFYDEEMNWVGNAGGNWNRTEPTTLYAKWTPLTYGIDFYSEGGFAYNMPSVTYGAVTFPTGSEAGLSKPNYTFMGWNAYDSQDWAMYQPGQTYAIGLSEQQGATVTLHAAWKENEKYTISFNANGGSREPVAAVVYVGTDYPIPPQVPVRDQNTFLGWSVDSTAADPTWAVGQYIPGVSGNMVLYAVWAQNPKLTYDANGGAFGVYVPDEYPTKGELHPLMSATPAREGYDFAGWAETAEGEGAVYLGGEGYPMPETDTTLYAKWTPKRYFVEVDAGGYTVSGIDEAGYERGDTVVFAVEGSDFTVYANGAALPPTGGMYSFIITADTTLRVLSSTSNQFIVTYLPNGGQGGPADTGIYIQDAPVNVRFDDAPTREGYTVAGWAERPGADRLSHARGRQGALRRLDAHLLHRPF